MKYSLSSETRENYDSMWSIDTTLIKIKTKFKKDSLKFVLFVFKDNEKALKEKKINILHA